MGRYASLFLTDDEIRHSVHLQVIARRLPKRITLPDGWIPSNQIDRLIWRNLVMDWPLAKVIKRWPNMTVNFVNKNLFGK
jgi:hypothetical protein